MIYKESMENNSTFIDCRDIMQHDHIVQKSNSMDVISFLLSNKLLPVIKAENRTYCLTTDINLIEKHLTFADNKLLFANNQNNLFNTVLSLDEHTTLVFPSKIKKLDPHIYAAIQNLIRSGLRCRQLPDIPETSFEYFPGIIISTTLSSIETLIKEQINRFKILNDDNLSQFANTAYYMGSKKSLKSFLCESLYQHVPVTNVIFDLMCGSGSASAGYNRFWQTYASDALDFCKILAIIQGGGYSRERAENCIDYIQPHIKQNFDQLSIIVGKYLEEEDHIFHMDIDDSLLNKYLSFINKTPVVTNNKNYFQFHIVEEIDKRKINKKLSPFCLFTYYFANKYFGLRQSMEIDSIRYGISRLKGHDYYWAMGSLIATVSFLGTNYGGHFAQPIKICKKNIYEILEKRSMSITSEFIIRFLSLAYESSISERYILPIDGPWEKALNSLKSVEVSRDVMVYIDAPYSREEYSRYYHVLETLVMYNYPSCIGTGLAPNKKLNERFSSSFFTRSKKKINTLFIDLISSVLRNNWNCAWSYSDNGIADIKVIIEEIVKCNNTNVEIFATPFKHKPQGGARSKKVIEYLILFLKKE
ncbi:MAG: hypothetical protein AB1641_05860 [Thermodesulfobacteriota bacterium]